MNTAQLNIDFNSFIAEPYYLTLVKNGRSNHYEICYAFATEFIKTATRFTSEDLIEAYEKKELPEPKEKKVWGAVMNKLRNQKLIVSDGYVKYRNPAGHGKPSTQWKVINNS